MYNGIGLQTPRGSGTNGYVQTNKFLIRGRTSKVVVDENKGFGPDQGMGGVSKKANKEILEHDRKRQIELKLVILEDKLSEQGYTDAEIAEKCEELRRKLEAEAAAADDRDAAVAVSNNKVSDTETHQVAARKEKQMEKLRVALDLPASVKSTKQTKQGNLIDVDIAKGDAKHFNVDSEREEGEILHGDEDVNVEKNYQDQDESKDHLRKTKLLKNKRRHGSESSASESKDDSSDSESDYDRKAKKNKKSTKLSKKTVSDESHDSDSDSDKSYKGRRKDVDKYSKVSKRCDSSSESAHSDRSPGDRAMKSKHHLTSRHDGKEHAIDTYKKRAASDREMVPTGSDRGKRYDRDDYNKRLEDKYYKRSDISGQGTKSVMAEPDRNQNRRRYDTDEDDVNSDYEEKKGSRRIGRHDSEDDDSDVETDPNERVKDKEKRPRYLKSKADTLVKGSDKELDCYRDKRVNEHGESWRKHDRVEDEQIYKKHDKLEAEDGTKKRETRTEGEHVSRRHEIREEGSLGERKQERKEDIDQERRKWEKKVSDDHERRKKDVDEDDYDRRKIEKDMHERKGRERRDEDEPRKRKLEERKDDEERSRKIDYRDDDEYRTRKRERREESEPGRKKRESWEENEKQDKNLERREEDEYISRKRGRGEELRSSKRVRQEEEDHGAKYREGREKELKSRNERKEQDRHERKTRERLEEEDRGRRRQEKEEGSSRNDDVRRRR